MTSRPSRRVASIALVIAAAALAMLAGGGGSMVHQLHGVRAMATGTRKEAIQPASRIDRDVRGRAQKTAASRADAGRA